MEPRVAVYVRVSTDSQNHESQEAELREYCQRRGWKNVTWYRDTASGARQDRQGLADLMTKIRKGKVDVLLCYKLDRLGRSLSHLAQILAELQSCRVALICPSQGIDTTDGNPAAHLQLNILGAVAQFEREIITERVSAGIKAAQARGVKFGRPAASDARKQQVLALAAEGHKAKAISKSTRTPYSSVTEIIRSAQNQY
ncbi:recombinase family protein [Prosthecobacter dejongeii]|uniref:DNA invertase Pin-like site-specific DNA recombinase n=1 Tax=Prosthecobacter dejongeii TaxID=48465 RepID=A0A7W7YH84_9BACT|nr:recombinase family protein [Prosthecobacter dejongeii]MBB5036160.1 DNA invertase Pin-like site-specific DNA recombinase [Prosthecobacter dejongeii]